MALKKCPRCEVNYIKEDETYCDVCKRYSKGHSDSDNDGIPMCIECGENPAVKGGELCAMCLRESRRQEKLEKLGSVVRSGDILLSDVELSDMEMPLPGDSDIPESELEAIHEEFGDDMEDSEDEENESGELSLDKMRADEYEDDIDDEE